MRTFEQLRRYIKENIPDPFKAKKGEGPDFEKNLEKAKSKGLKTYKQKGLDLYKAGGPYIPDKEVSQKTGKKVTQQIKKPYFGKPTLPKKTTKAPDRKGLKQAISDVRAGEKRLYDAGVGKKPSLVQQRKFTLSKIKQLSRQTTLKDKLYGSTNVGGGGASGRIPRKIKPKTVPTPTKGVKQSEVSKKAKDFTKKINQQRKVTTSGTPMRKGATSIPKDAAKDIQIEKMKNRIKELGAEREKMRSFTGKKDVKGMRAVNKQIKQYQKSIKSNPFAPTVYDPKNKPTTTGTTGSSKVTINRTSPNKKPYQSKTQVTGDVTGRGRPRQYDRSTKSSITNLNKNSISKSTVTTNKSGFDGFYSDKAYKAGRSLPKPIQKLGKSKPIQKVLKTVIKNPKIAAGVLAGTALAAGGYGIYKGVKKLVDGPYKIKGSDTKSAGKIMDKTTGKPYRTQLFRKDSIKNNPNLIGPSNPGYKQFMKSIKK